MPHTPLTAEPGAPELAGVRFTEAGGAVARRRLQTGARLRREFGREQEAAIKRQEERAKKRRRTAELFSIAGTIAGFLIPGGGLAGAALTRGLAGAAVGGRVGAAIGTAAAGAPPGALALELPGTFGAVAESRRLGELESALQFRPELTFQPGPFAPGPVQRGPFVPRSAQLGRF